MMKNNMMFFLRLLLLGCIIPIIVSSIVYNGFTTNYTVSVFSKRGFEYQYQAGIYKYRVLGNTTLLKTYDLIKRYDLPTFAPRSLGLLDYAGDPQFYSAYFYMNTFFLCLTSMILLIILGGYRKNTDFMMVDLPVLFMCFLIGISQYVVVPYDTLSYFFLSIAVLLIINDNGTLWNLLGLCAIVILATLTRETAAFILSFYFAINYKTILTHPTTFKINQKQAVLIIMTACFALTYFGLRWVFGYEHAIYEAFVLSKNLERPDSILGILFFMSISLIIFITKAVQQEISVFFILTLPYVLFIWLFADPWEIRLWTPLILLLIIMKVRASQSLISQETLSEAPDG
jgi:hypothetical protein